MKRLIAVLVLAAFPVFGASPLAALKKVFTGKTGLVISIGALGAAEFSDYRTTGCAISSGLVHEGNSLITNADGTLNTNRFIAFKIDSFGVLVAAESYLYYRMNAPQREKYTKWMIIGNWLGAAAVGGIAAHNHALAPCRVSTIIYTARPIYGGAIPG